MRLFAFNDLPNAPLIVDAIYEGGSAPNVGADPIARLLPGAGNQGGFRASGAKGRERFVVLYSSSEDPDWPDELDASTGQFTYFGDNKRPGHELHSTARGGNDLLRRVFASLHRDRQNRDEIPPFFVFEKCETERSSRSVQFKGIAAPGFPGLPPTADLVAVWKSTGGERFQNYRAVFTVLDAAAISRSWIQSLVKPVSPLDVPSAWTDWVDKGVYRPLVSEPTTNVRSAEDQCPQNDMAKAILETVWKHFRENPIAFEHFAARIFQLHDPRVIVDGITRPAVDGGRDAVGRYSIGLNQDPVFATFSLEAKCYAPPLDGHSANSVGVKDVARLISRIRHREFGVLVTTSFIARQAYQEVRADRHPIIFISGGDISNILIRSGFQTPEMVVAFLAAEFP